MQPNLLGPLSVCLIVLISNTLAESNFHNREWQMDLFGLGNFHREAKGGYANEIVRSSGGPDIGSQRQLSGRPAWGFGVAANFFFNPYIGLGVDQSIFGRHQGSRQPESGDFYYMRWQTSGYLTFRHPITSLNLAPYALIGGGAQYGDSPNLPIPVGQTRRNYTLSGQGFGQLGGGIRLPPIPTLGNL